MYVRRDRKKNAKGEEVGYLSIAHNIVEDSPKGKRTKPIVFANLGPEENITGEMALSMARAFERYAAKRLGEKPQPEKLSALAAETKVTSPAFRLLASRELGMRLFLSAPWKALGIGKALQAYEKKHRIEFPLERVVFAMVLNRLVDPKSKRACNEWVKSRGFVPEAKDWPVQHFYRALDVLHEHWEELEELLAKHLSAMLTDEERRRLLIDTTSMYFESELSDREITLLDERWDEFDTDGTVRAPRRSRPSVVNETQLRMRGHNKDGHPECPQVVIAHVCAPGGLVLRHRVYPGNTSDATIAKDLVHALKKPLAGTVPVWVSDAGMVGKDQLALLDEALWERVTAEPPRKSKLAMQLLDGLTGRFRKDPLREHMSYRVVDVPADESPSGRAERWVFTRNDRERERHLDKVAVEMNRKPGPNMAHAKSVCGIVSNVSLRKYIKPSEKVKGAYVFDQQAIARERKLAGVRCYRTTLVELDGLEILRMYGELQDVESRHRQLKHPLALRPCYHRAERRIRAHVMLTILAANCAAYIERETGLPLEKLRTLAEDVKANEIEQGNSRYWQRSEIPAAYEEALSRLDVKLPPIVWNEWIEPGEKSKKRKAKAS